MDDRELLEYSATAAGRKFYWEDGGLRDCKTGIRTNWNPLTDDGDALRLAVKLGITDLKLIVGELVFAEGFIGDPYVAVRRAIVRAAAELATAKS